MSELTRRDLLRLGATGLAAVSIGGLTVLSSKAAMAVCLPPGPTRDPNNSPYITCPDDYDPNREEGFIFSRKNDVDHIIDWGIDGYYPFDGSMFLSSAETGKEHLLRSVCGDAIHQTPAGQGVKVLDRSAIYIPPVPPLTIPRPAVGGGRVRPTFQIALPSTLPILNPSQHTGVKPERIAAAQLVIYKYKIMGKAPWEKINHREPHNPQSRFLKKSSIVGHPPEHPTAPILPQELFNGEVISFPVPEPSATYHCFLEVLYDYENLLGDDNSYRYFGARTEIFELSPNGNGRPIGKYLPGRKPKYPRP